MKSPDLTEADRLTLSGEIDLRCDAESLRRLEIDTGERRSKPRIKKPFPTRAWGVDAAGEAFQIDCVLDNMSSTGVYLRMPKKMRSGDELSLAIRLLNGADGGAATLVRGHVLRDEPQADGLNGIALAIKHYEFL
jgi:hypothetical protein